MPGWPRPGPNALWKPRYSECPTHWQVEALTIRKTWVPSPPTTSDFSFLPVFLYPFANNPKPRFSENPHFENHTSSWGRLSSGWQKGRMRIGCVSVCSCVLRVQRGRRRDLGIQVRTWREKELSRAQSGTRPRALIISKSKQRHSACSISEHFLEAFLWVMKPFRTSIQVKPGAPWKSAWVPLGKWDL
jgi:hypothetical protein